MIMVSTKKGKDVIETSSRSTISKIWSQCDCISFDNDNKDDDDIMRTKTLTKIGDLNHSHSSILKRSVDQSLVDYNLIHIIE